MRYLHSFPTRRSSDLRVLLVDANGAPQPPGVAQGFRDAISITRADQIEYVTNQKITAIDVGAKTVTTDKGQSYRYDLDRKSTRLNSSHQIISYAVFCL